MPTLDFKGKQFVHSHHLSVPFRELQVVPKKSLPGKGRKPSLDDNLIIHGDNLEALKALLPTHAGKVDCIFIDPPYNTGNEGWCYNDNVRSPLMREWIKKAANPVDKEDLERHDKWLCMMWPRLQLLRELLAEDGAIFITIDDNEVHRLRLIMDEIFGEEGFITAITWQARYSRSNDAVFSLSHNTVLVYGKDTAAWEKTRNLLDRDAKQETQYTNPDNDPRGPWRAIPWDAPNIRENLSYPIKTPTGKTKFPPSGRHWSRTEDKWKEIVAAGLDYYGRDGNGSPSYKAFLKDASGIVPNTWWAHDDAGHTDEAKKELIEILGTENLAFATPKPCRLLERILQVATQKDSLILDSFAGSGTTAHAVLAANARDGGNRRFILVESENYADTLTAERIRRVIQGYSFTGTQRTELLREKVTWRVFEKADEMLEKIKSIEQLEGAGYDNVKKEIKDGVLIVTGLRSVEEKTPGLGGSFTYCELGDPIEIETLLTGGDGMPTYESLARYVYYTATGRSLEKVAAPKADGFIGETEQYRLHLIYKPDKEWLRGNDAALDTKKLAAIEKGNRGGKRAIVFAVAKFMSQRELSARRIEFCQLPYAVHKILGD
ncbi:MAG: site-specific DNA-methyltransferase [Verrucomicrobiales bacterium]|nr:site-specific DNA-methyltransferase [Verrucomicrobiales bacterium]